MIQTQLIGRFGNQLFQYAHARALAEQTGQELRTPRWVGEKIFKIEPTAEPDPAHEWLGGYRQNQESLIYTRRDCKRWFEFKPEILGVLSDSLYDSKGVTVAHMRRGDYFGYGYVVVRWESYMKAADEFGTRPIHRVCSDEHQQSQLFNGVCDWLPDFYSMMTAGTLLRANSSFSWWAATLGTGRVFSPIVAGLEGGKEQECEFCEGNHPRFADLPNITDLHLPE